MRCRVTEIQGSSPLVRGRRSDAYCRLSRAGFIPARAGEALDGREPALVAKVHPRSCGGGQLRR